MRYSSWRRQAIEAANARKQNLLQRGVSDQGSPIPDLLKQLEFAREKAALVSEKQDAKAKAVELAAVAAEEKRAKRELSTLVSSLKYKPFKVMALKAAEPAVDPAEIESMPVKDVELRLLSFSLRDLQSVCINLMPLVAEAIAARAQKGQGKKRGADQMGSISP